MNAKDILTSILVISLFAAAGCKKDSPISHSGCKEFSQKSDAGGHGPDHSCVIYSYAPFSRVLSVRHVNAAFNCCVKKIYCDVDVTDGSIVFTEREGQDGQKCDCLCLYDIEVEAKDVTAKKYRITFHEPYAPDEEQIEFEADLGLDPEGVFCVARTAYPWWDMGGK